MDDMQNFIDESMKNGEFDKAYHAKSIQAKQKELNRIRSERIEKPMFKVSSPMTYAIDPNDAKDWQTESPEEFKRRQEVDQRRNFKLFLHHAKLLSERYPNWTVQPDPNNPFKNVLLTHKNNKYRIESAYPSNEIKVWGIETEHHRRTQDFANKFGVPSNIFNISPYTVPIPTFCGWSIGMEDTPTWIKE